MRYHRQAKQRRRRRKSARASPATRRGRRTSRWPRSPATTAAARPLWPCSEVIISIIGSDNLTHCNTKQFHTASVIGSGNSRVLPHYSTANQAFSRWRDVLATCSFIPTYILFRKESFVFVILVAHLGNRQKRWINVWNPESRHK